MSMTHPSGDSRHVDRTGDRTAPHGGGRRPPRARRHRAHRRPPSPPRGDPSRTRHRDTAPSHRSTARRADPGRDAAPSGLRPPEVHRTGAAPTPAPPHTPPAPHRGDPAAHRPDTLHHRPGRPERHRCPMQPARPPRQEGHRPAEHRPTGRPDTPSSRHPPSVPDAHPDARAIPGCPGVTRQQRTATGHRAASASAERTRHHPGPEHPPPPRPGIPPRPHPQPGRITPSATGHPATHPGPPRGAWTAGPVRVAGWNPGRPRRRMAPGGRVGIAPRPHRTRPGRVRTGGSGCRRSGVIGSSPSG